MPKYTTHYLTATIFCLAMAALTLWSAAAAGSETDDISETISLTVKDEPLVGVLRTIADKSGYVIATEPEFANLPVTVSFQELTLDQALWRVLGKLNRYVIIDDTDRRISFKLVDHPGVPVSASLDQNDSPGADTELVPPDEPGQAPVTLGRIKQMRKGKPLPNQEDIELVPPETPGTRPITMKDIKARKNYDNLEIIPPDEPDQKGLTLKEIEKLKVNRQKP